MHAAVASASPELRKRTNIHLAHGTAACLAMHKFQVGAKVGKRLSTATPSKPADPSVANDLLQAVINSAPGAYPGDDGSPEILERYNFYVHGKRFLFSPCSLGYFPESNRFRQRVIWCITWKRFDQFILLLIFANSIILALADYSKIDANGDLDPTQSSRNAVVFYADRVFTALFAVECSMKIVAMGLIGEQGAYLMDPWNWMDFVVVFVGILAVIPGIPNVSVLRTFRVLRPLRSLNAVAGMKKLVTALLKSIPELLSVVAFLLFLFFLYGVIAIQLWSGALHPRCRLTPFPVRLDANVTYATLPAHRAMVISNYSHFPCLDEHAQPIPVANTTWSQQTSPWKHPRLCFWPIADESPKQTCSLWQAQSRMCPVGQTCGSDYDSHGNFRFAHPDAAITRYELESATYNADMGWGFVNFDNIAMASLAIFQCITREGWSDIMYMLQDAGFGLSAVVFFVSFIIVGSFFMLNLTLAVIWENFSDASFVEAEERKLAVAAQQKKQLKDDAVQHAARASGGSGSHDRSVASRRFRICKAIERVLDHSLFHALRTALIVINTVILSLDKYPIDDDLDAVVEVINFALTLAFLLEVVLKVVGLGLKRWAQDRYNLFDAVVVLLSVVELVLAPPKLLTGTTTGVTQKTKAASFSGLRSIRLFALFKLARSWPSLQKLLATMLSTIKEVGNFSVLLLVFMYIYALIGMQTFANEFRFDAHGYPVGDRSVAGAYVPRSNFDTLLWSMVTVFQILTGENWNVVMLDGWRSSGWTAVLYFVSLVVFGNFIVLNLFLAILLGNFEESFDDEKKDARDEMMRKKTSRVAPLQSRRSEREGGGGGDVRTPSTRSLHTETEATTPTTTIVQAFHAPSGRSRRESGTMPAKIFEDQLSSVSQRLAFERKDIPATLTGRSLFVFSLTHPMRKAATALIRHPQFDNVSLLLVAVSTVALAIDNPLNAPDSPFVSALAWLDIALTVLFLLEVAIKVVALGFVLDKHAYLRDSWNAMDFGITVLAAVSLSHDSARFKFVKTLRTFRALRPLRMINRNPGLKLVVSSLMASIPQIVNVIVVCLLVFTIFSILAVNNLKGKLYSCSGAAFDALSAAQQALVTQPRGWQDLAPTEQAWFSDAAAAAYAGVAPDAVTSKVVCLLLGATWGPTIAHSFDNVLLGCQAFFEMTTTEGWVTVMLAGVDATEIDMQPIVNNREGWAFFFVAFILVGTFFVMQLFVGVVIENFNKMKEKLDGTYLLSSTQREWLVINDVMLHLRPVRKLRTPQHKARRFCFECARSPTFEVAIMGCIVLNTVVMALHYFGEDDVYRAAIEYSNYTFACVFALEAAVKLTGLGRYYWKDSWNVFDFVIVSVSSLGMFYTWAGGSAAGPLGAMIRSTRAGRLFRLVQSAPSLRQLFNTLMTTLPSLVNIGGLLFLVFFIYAAMGVQLFAKVKFGDLVTETTNFQSMSRAMITLVRCATGERWNDLMYELTRQDACVEDPPFDPAMCGFNTTETCVPLNGCGSQVAVFYLYSFTLLVSFILLNIFIAVILEGFANEKDRMDGLLQPHNYTNFVETWSLFDPEATGYLEWHVLPDFLTELAPPMGLGKHPMPAQKDLLCLIDFLDLPVFRGNKVFFNDVARRLGKFVVDELSDDPLEALPATLNLEQRWRKYLLHRNVRKQDMTVSRVNQFHAAELIHRSVKALMLREDLALQVAKFVVKTKEARAPPAPSSPVAQPLTSDARASDSDDSSDASIFGSIH